jgi:hypothetical protein
MDVTQTGRWQCDATGSHGRVQGAIITARRRRGRFLKPKGRVSCAPKVRRSLPQHDRSPLQVRRNPVPASGSPEVMWEAETLRQMRPCALSPCRRNRTMYRSRCLAGAGRSPSMIWPITPGAQREVCTRAPNHSQARFTLHETEVWLLRQRFATESSRSLRRRVGRPWAAGRRTGSGQGRPRAACPWFQCSFPSIGCGSISES